MNLQITKFGTLQPVYIHNGKILCEIATFNTNGRSHQHDNFEICNVIKGKGRIIIYKNGVKTTHVIHPGCIVTIPPNTDHWMEVDDDHIMVILISYSIMVVYSDYKTLNPPNK